jgi:hypothetical protein
MSASGGRRSHSTTIGATTIAPTVSPSHHVSQIEPGRSACPGGDVTVCRANRRGNRRAPAAMITKRSTSAVESNADRAAREAIGQPAPATASSVLPAQSPATPVSSR